MAATDATERFVDRGGSRVEVDPATRRIIGRSRQPCANQACDQAAAGGKALVAAWEPGAGRAQMDSAGPADWRSRAQAHGLRQLFVPADVANHDRLGPGWAWNPHPDRGQRLAVGVRGAPHARPVGAPCLRPPPSAALALDAGDLPTPRPGAAG